ncbi:hypothetical protein lbkm_0495 [Lachnospiraceae bacterium KM106-2]|nr:hypothetical protein lbkm_0495 [Lachnospiraceae bacterium KM106-2]
MFVYGIIVYVIWGILAVTVFISGKTLLENLWKKEYQINYEINDFVYSIGMVGAYSMIYILQKSILDGEQENIILSMLLGLYLIICISVYMKVYTNDPRILLRVLLLMLFPGFLFIVYFIKACL